MKLRPYQQEAVDAILEAWKTHQAALLVLPTGTGKTIIFAHLVDRIPYGRVMILAHREELIWQACDKVRRVTGHEPDIEMAEYRADHGMLRRAKVVVSSIQTQMAGMGGDGRMTRFNPGQFAAVIVDEAHHATAASYRKVLAHYQQNEDLKILGVTATPDRADERALGQVFQTVAMDYELTDAIMDGWLVPIHQRAVTVQELDLSGVRTTAGDLNGADLARVMEYEKVLHAVAGPAMELMAGRRTLLFAASVAHAERLCEIFNRHKADSARFVCATTPSDKRRQIFDDYRNGEFQILTNVGIATEGFDEPGIEVIVQARPTKSRCLYAQMIGRATRPLTGTVDGIDAAAGRRAAIAESRKPFCEVIDFVGNSGRHRLITAADILGGNFSDAVVDRARKKAEASGNAEDVTDLLAQAQKEIEAEREARRRAFLTPDVKFITKSVDPFQLWGLQPWRERGWNAGRPATEKQIALLEKFGIPVRDVNFTQASQLITEIIERRQKGRCTYKQAKWLARYGYRTDVSFDEAKEILDRLWSKKREKAEAVEKF